MVQAGVVFRIPLTGKAKAFELWTLFHGTTFKANSAPRRVTFPNCPLLCG